MPNTSVCIGLTLETADMVNKLMVIFTEERRKEST